MKLNIYETDKFFHYLAMDDNGKPWQLDEDFASEVPDELVKEYLETYKKFKDISYKLAKIKQGGSK